MARNRNEELFASAARTATPTAAVVTEDPAESGTSLIVHIDVTAVTATPSVVPSIEGYDPVSGNWYTILTGAALTAVSNVTLMVGPTLIDEANLTANSPVPAQWRLSMTHADADSITYSAGAEICI